MTRWLRSFFTPLPSLLRKSYGVSYLETAVKQTGQAILPIALKDMAQGAAFGAIDGSVISGAQGAASSAYQQFRQEGKVDTQTVLEHAKGNAVSGAIAGGLFGGVLSGVLSGIQNLATKAKMHLNDEVRQRNQHAEVEHNVKPQYALRVMEYEQEICDALDNNDILSLMELTRAINGKAPEGKKLFGMNFNPLNINTPQKRKLIPYGKFDLFNQFKKYAKSTDVRYLQMPRELVSKLGSSEPLLGKVFQFLADDVHLPPSIVKRLDRYKGDNLGRTPQQIQSMIDELYGTGRYALDGENALLGVGTVGETWRIKDLHNEGGIRVIKFIRQNVSQERLDNLQAFMNTYFDYYTETPEGAEFYKKRLAAFIKGVREELDLSKEYDLGTKLKDAVKDIDNVSVINMENPGAVNGKALVMDLAPGVGVNRVMDLMELVYQRNMSLDDIYRLAGQVAEFEEIKKILKDRGLLKERTQTLGQIMNGRRNQEIKALLQKVGLAKQTGLTVEQLYEMVEDVKRCEKAAKALTDNPWLRDTKLYPKLAQDYLDLSGKLFAQPRAAVPGDLQPANLNVHYKVDPLTGEYKAHFTLFDSGNTIPRTVSDIEKSIEFAMSYLVADSESLAQYFLSMTNLSDKTGGLGKDLKAKIVKMLDDEVFVPGFDRRNTGQVLEKVSRLLDAENVDFVGDELRYAKALLQSVKVYDRMAKTTKQPSDPLTTLRSHANTGLLKYVKNNFFKSMHMFADKIQTAFNNNVWRTFRNLTNLLNLTEVDQVRVQFPRITRFPYGELSAGFTANTEDRKNGYHTHPVLRNNMEQTTFLSGNEPWSQSRPA